MILLAIPNPCPTFDNLTLVQDQKAQAYCYFKEEDAQTCQERKPDAW